MSRLRELIEQTRRYEAEDEAVPFDYVAKRWERRGNGGLVVPVVRYAPGTTNAQIMAHVDWELERLDRWQKELAEEFHRRHRLGARGSPAEATKPNIDDLPEGTPPPHEHPVSEPGVDMTGVASGGVGERRQRLYVGKLRRGR